jgi:hypothetical protein
VGAKNRQKATLIQNFDEILLNFFQKQITKFCPFLILSGES